MRLSEISRLTNHLWLKRKNRYREIIMINYDYTLTHYDSPITGRGKYITRSESKLEQRICKELREHWPEAQDIKVEIIEITRERHLVEA
ncbi:MAG: hypothetical protein KDH97_10075 [Calditrichaeota bacterium]|nr:hypothetical protein [Calditrichota bacterium]